MTRKYRVLLLGMIGVGIYTSSLAQVPQAPCTKEDVVNISTNWTTPLVKSSTAQSQRQQKILQILKAAYPKPTGLVPNVHGFLPVDGDPGNEYIDQPKGSPLRYSVTTYFHTLLCDAKKGTTYRDGETHTWIIAYINSLTTFLVPAHFKLPNGQPLYFMPRVVGQLKGYPVYDTQKWKDIPDESVVLAVGDKLPVRPVSRDEVLSVLTAEVNMQMAELEAAQIKLAEALKESLAEADKMSFKTPEEREKYKQGNIREVENGKSKSTQMIASFRQRLQAIEQLRASMSPADRAKQAVLNDIRDLVPIKGKAISFEEQEKTGRALVVRDLTWGNKKQAPHSIQLIQLLMHHQTDARHVAKKEMIRQFKENIDVEALRKLLEVGS
ncbi:hypothetical protein P2H89_15670 [Paraflavitalea sp. CAU 1676]|nr:hypothetical protein [Paraflavitalea sp. CAU 1676]